MVSSKGRRATVDPDERHGFTLDDRTVEPTAFCGARRRDESALKPNAPDRAAGAARPVWRRQPWQLQPAWWQPSPFL
jgi:hypothetical protein